MAVVTMKQLLESGVHFGHQTRRWNPKMKRYILTERNGIYIIDLQQTLSYIDRAYEFVKETVAHGGTIMFVGTKKQAQEAIAEEAGRVNMPYVNQRWLGGMLTNFQTVHKRLQRLKELESMEQTGGFEGRTKKEILMLTREKDKLEKTLGGIRDMAKVPSAIWVVDTKKEHIAVGEARKLGIPVVSILDTNCDPDEVDYPIPGNDDAIRSVGLLTRVVADAVADGLMARSGQGSAATGEELGGDEPMAAWERELLESQNAAAADTPADAAAAAASQVDRAAQTEIAQAETPGANTAAADAPATDVTDVTDVMPSAETAAAQTDGDVTVATSETEAPAAIDASAATETAETTETTETAEASSGTEPAAEVTDNDAPAADAPAEGDATQS